MHNEILQLDRWSLNYPGFEFSLGGTPADPRTKDLVGIPWAETGFTHHMRGKAEAVRVTRKSPHRITWLSYHNKPQGLLGDRNVCH